MQFKQLRVQIYYKQYTTDKYMLGAKVSLITVIHWYFYDEII
jgi:hypothetical protein